MNLHCEVSRMHLCNIDSLSPSFSCGLMRSRKKPEDLDSQIKEEEYQRMRNDLLHGPEAD